MPWVQVLGAASIAVSVLLTAGCAATPTPEATQKTRVDLLAETIRCMQDLGFEAEADGFGGFSGPETSAELVEQWQAAGQQCIEQTGWGVEDYDEEQLAELFTLEVEQYECLIELGYSPNEPPSLQQYIDSWSSRTEPPYQPFGSVVEGLPPEELRFVLEACPPPRWSFNG